MRAPEKTRQDFCISKTQACFPWITVSLLFDTYKLPKINKEGLVSGIYQKVHQLLTYCQSYPVLLWGNSNRMPQVQGRPLAYYRRVVQGKLPCCGSGSWSKLGTLSSLRWLYQTRFLCATGQHRDYYLISMGRGNRRW